MIKKIFIAIFLSVVLASASNAFAQETENLVEQELNVNLKQELGLENYDPIVPDNFVNSIGFSFKSFARGIKKAAIGTFGSRESYSQLVKNEAGKRLIEARKLIEKNPEKFAEKAAGIMEKYKDNLADAESQIDSLKKENPVFAKNFSSELAKQHLFTAPKVLSQMEEDVLDQNSEAAAKIAKFKRQAIKHAANSVILSFDDGQEIADTFNFLSDSQHNSPFSSIYHAEILNVAKQQLPDSGSGRDAGLGQAITDRLKQVEGEINLNSGQIKRFEEFVGNFPGANIARIQVLDQLKSQGQLPPEALEKMQEMKAKVAEKMSEAISHASSKEARARLSQARMEFENPRPEDFKTLAEMKDLVSSEQIREEIAANEEKHVAKFLDKFNADDNAKQVTEEFAALTKKVKKGEVTPDANFFKAMENLRGRLSAEQRQFISEMEKTGRKEMFERMKEDSHFAERFATYNPADIGQFEQIKQQHAEEIPRDANFELKLKEIGNNQTENFKRFLEFHEEDSEKFSEIKMRFERELPEGIRQKYEREYKFDFAKEFERREAPAYHSELKGDDAKKFCAQRNGTWDGSNCSSANNSSNVMPEKLQEMIRSCQNRGGAWQQNACPMPASPRVDFNRELNSNPRHEPAAENYGKPFFGSPQNEGFSKPEFENSGQYERPAVESFKPEVQGIVIESNPYDLSRLLWFFLPEINLQKGVI